MLEQRSRQQELMDDGSRFDRLLAGQSFRFIRRINRLFGGTRIVWDFVRAEAAALHEDRPLKILDIGAGCCDIPIAVCRRAARAGIRVEFTCIEKEPHAIECARITLAGQPDLPIRLLHQDILEHRVDPKYDAATGSMFFHHLSDREIPPMILRLRSLVRGRLLINDLERCRPNYLGAALLSLPESPGVKNDARLSVKRGFRTAELETVLGCIPGTACSVRRRMFFRIAAVVDYEALDSSSG